MFLCEHLDELPLESTSAAYPRQNTPVLVSTTRSSQPKSRKIGTLSIGKMLAEAWLSHVAKRIDPDRPLLIGNLNLAVRYEIDVARALYDASERGLCVLAAGGRLQGNTLLVHGRLAQSGAASPAYQVVPPAEEGTPPSPGPVQDRLL